MLRDFVAVAAFSFQGKALPGAYLGEGSCLVLAFGFVGLGCNSTEKTIDCVFGAICIQVLASASALRDTGCSASSGVCCGNGVSSFLLLASLWNHTERAGPWGRRRSQSKQGLGAAAAH